MFMVAFGTSIRDVGKQLCPKLIDLSGARSFEVMFLEIPINLAKFEDAAGTLLLFGNVN